MPAASAAGTTRAGERRVRAAEKPSTASAETSAGRDHGQRAGRRRGRWRGRARRGWPCPRPAGRRARPRPPWPATTALRWPELPAGSMWCGRAPGRPRGGVYTTPCLSAPRASCAAALRLLLAGSAAAHAQIGVSLNRAGSGARAAGMADAFIAVSDDGTAASWNPAGLAQLRQPEFSLRLRVSDQGLGLRRPALAGRPARLRDAAASPTRNSSDRLRERGRAVLHRAQAGHPAGRLAPPLPAERATSAGPSTACPLRPAGPARPRCCRATGLDGNIDVISVAGAVKLTLAPRGRGQRRLLARRLDDRTIADRGVGRGRPVRLLRPPRQDVAAARAERLRRPPPHLSRLERRARLPRAVLVLLPRRQPGAGHGRRRRRASTRRRALPPARAPWGRAWRGGSAARWTARRGR